MLFNRELFCVDGDTSYTVLLCPITCRAEEQQLYTLNRTSLLLRILNHKQLNSNTTGVTSGAGTAISPGAHEFMHGF
jgi:hypothetical protein